MCDDKGGCQCKAILLKRGKKQNVLTKRDTTVTMVTQMFSRGEYLSKTCTMVSGKTPLVQTSRSIRE
uniref:Uncharacterized protein n=1 Tax=Anguilla anguilla TaxID=7936 RepID=A0A0E9TEC2_ANGAN